MCNGITYVDPPAKGNTIIMRNMNGMTSKYSLCYAITYASSLMNKVDHHIQKFVDSFY
jgi:hypothetical protein